MNKAKKSKSPVVELQKVNDNLLAFYGTVDDQIGMIPRVEKCGLKYDPQKLEMIKSLVAEEKIDYYRIVNVVVSKCNYTIKCIPKNSSRQKISQIAIDMSPKSHYSRGRDGLGNEQIYGLNEEDHSTFIFHITGSAVTGLAGFILASLFTRRQKQLVNSLHDGKAMLFTSLATLTGPFIGVSLSLMATLYTSTGVAQTLMSITPVLILWPSVVFFKQKITALEIVGAVISVVGVTMFFI